MTDFLQLKSLRTALVSQSEGGYSVEVVGVASAPRCHHCQSMLLYGHGTVRQTFQDIPSHGRPVTLQVTRKRYRCRDCSRTLFEPIADLDDQRYATRRLIDFVVTESFRRPFLPVAEAVGLDEKTIRNMFGDYVEQLRQTVKFETPEVLGVDELKIIGQYRCMLTNVEKRTIFDLLPTRKLTDLTEYFRKLPDKERVRWVTMDMWQPYRQVATKHLPNARIVVDRFHIQRTANNELERIRKQIRKSLTQHQRLKLKNDRFVLLKRLHNLSPKEADVLRGIFKVFPQLEEAHAHKEGFLSIWDTLERADAERAFARWANTIPLWLQNSFGTIAKTVDNWNEPVFAYWDKRITNAYTESVNGVAKGMNRLGRGYSFDVLRARLLYQSAARAASAQRIREAVADFDDVMFTKVVTRVINPPTKRVRYTEPIVEYGPSMDVLAKMLAAGEFDDK